MPRTQTTVIAILALIGLGGAAYQLAARVAIENASRTVGIVVDYDEVRRLAAASGVSVAEVLR
ncbi:MAG: hypothetical protein H5T86_13020, partial [Armatimonadetes bacterium]|nr:hypothetical protein [Armatimonadota bacterium]